MLSDMSLNFDDSLSLMKRHYKLRDWIEVLPMFDFSSLSNEHVWDAFAESSEAAEHDEDT